MISIMTWKMTLLTSLPRILYRTRRRIQASVYIAQLVQLRKVIHKCKRYLWIKIQNVSIHTLKKFGARVTNDESRVVLPVANRQGEVIGFESISLLHYFPQVIRRFIKEEVKAFSVMSSSRKEERVIVVPTCCDVLVLAEHNIPAVSLPSASAEVLAEYLLDCGKNEVVLWYRGEAPPRPLLLSLVEVGVSCSLVLSSLNDRPIHTKPVEEIKAALRTTIPVVSESITTFQQLKDKIYHRITHKEEVKTLWGSFEVSIVRLCEVMLQQFSGVPLPQDLTNFNTLASQFSILPLHFLTYHGQQKISTIIEMMTKAVKIWGIQHVIIDNLQFMLGTCEQQQDRWLEQDRAVTAFRRFATLNNCHVTLVVHPKKVSHTLTSL
nr:twinkle mtDNA helicase-like isoform X2 [Cherax quadricarinatus]